MLTPRSLSSNVFWETLREQVYNCLFSWVYDITPQFLLETKTSSLRTSTMTTASTARIATAAQQSSNPRPISPLAMVMVVAILVPIIHRAASGKQDWLTHAPRIALLPGMQATTRLTCCA